MIVLLCLCMYIDVSLQMVACSFKKKKRVLGGASLLAQMVKNLPAVQETPGSRRLPGEGNGNLLRYSYLENSMDRGS